MAPPVKKRRKTEHVSSSDDEESEEASFASFSEDEQLNGEDSHAGGLDGAGSDSGSGDEITDGSEGGHEETDGSEGADEDATMADVGVDDDAKSIPSKAKQETRQKPDRKETLGASSYASATFKSNVFKLQVDELLAQIRPRQGRREEDAKAAVHKLKAAIEQIPARGPFLVNDAERNLVKEKIAIPFPEPHPPRDANFKFSYQRPDKIDVVGSYRLQTSSRSRERVELDMVVTMPSSMFDEKDFVNLRYFYKRAYYLACVAAGLQKSLEHELTFQFQLMHGDSLKPILVIGSNSESTHKWRINMIPCTSETQFSADKLRPDKNSVRNTDAAEEGSQTPFYNSSLRADMLYASYMSLLHNACKTCEAFKDACLLGSTWLRQRGFDSAIQRGGFGTFEWSALVALCLYGGGPNGKALLSGGYSSYQLFKATLQFLAMKDLVKAPICIGSDANPPKLDGTPIFWDSARSHNLLYKAGAWGYKSLRHEARSTLAALGDQLHDGFDATFILRVQEPLYRHDYAVVLPHRLLSSRISHADHLHQVHAKRLHDTLRRGLGDRITHIDITMSTPSNWGLGSARPEYTGKSEVTVGLSINPDNARRTVDHGPSAEQKTEAAEFRKFWGEKAELRRFKDGSILESLVWQSALECGHSVVEQVVRYLLAHHFGAVTVDDLKFFGDGFSKLVKGADEPAVFSQIMSRYKQFETDIRSLSELPLSIRQIMPADAQLCYSSTRAPATGKGRPHPADVTIQFEGSGRWPDDLIAIQRTKAAFLLKIDELLHESVDSIETRIGLENEEQEALNQAYLDVTYGTDASFRLRIYHDREQTLHERQLKSKSTDPKSREIAAIGLARYKRDYLKKPAQVQAITRLCTRFPALSGSIRLTKKWFASHLLSNHISEEVIELLVVRTFTQPWPWQTPASVQSGFLRTLFWISKWDWRAEPLIVDLSASGELKQAGVQAIRTNFEAWRKLDPSMNRVALFAASNLDQDGTTYTDGQPAKVIAGRMTALAKAACGEIASKQLELEPASLFSSPLSDFDFVLQLNPVHGGVKPSRPSSAFKNLELESLNDSSLIGYDPVRSFLTELEEVYDSAVLFFYGGAERNLITGLWSPLTARRSWKVNLAYSTIPVKSNKDGEEDVQAALNKSAVLAEIARLGGNLVTKVEMVDK